MGTHADTARQFARDVDEIAGTGVGARSFMHVWTRTMAILRDSFQSVQPSLCKRCRRYRLFPAGSLSPPDEDAWPFQEWVDGAEIAPIAPAAIQMMMASHPEYVFPLGFDAVRYAVRKPGPRERAPEYCDACWRLVRPFFGLEVLAEYRDPSGRWVGAREAVGSRVGAKHPKGWGISLGRWCSAIERQGTAEHDEAVEVVSCGALWRPTGAVVNSDDTGIRDLLKAIKTERLPLEQIPWRRLEELVAELLRSRGMRVHLTPASRDGGRDIVAVGELIPGEPTTLAVEVKQKAVVGLADLRAALWANRNFPALLFATAGRFSAGVIRERHRGRMGLRLLLKDGVALRQWLNVYSASRQSPK